MSELRKYLMAVLIMVGVGPAVAEQSPTKSLPPLPPTELTETDSLRMQEQRVGNRLRQVTVERDNGLTEVYRNERDDAVWFAEEQSLGDLPNVRKWKIGGW